MSFHSKIEKSFKTHYSVLVSYAIKWVKDVTTAEDLVQMVFVNLLEKGERLKIQNEKAYLFQSVRHQCLAHLKKTRAEEFNSDSETEVGYFIDPIEAAEFETFVFGLIDKLPPATKRIFKMNRFEGYSNQEIADTLNLSKRTVELQISNALKNLREGLKKSDTKGAQFKDFIALLF